MSKFFSHLLLAVLLCITSIIKAQKAQRDNILGTVENDITKAINNDDLLTETGLNIVLQKRAFNYLTGVSDLALAKFYAGYTTESDRLSLGFNIPVYAKDHSISFVVNPVFEADVKSNFAELYKDGKWKNNIRAGMKLTWLMNRGSVSFDPANNRIEDFRVVQMNAYKAISDRFTKENNEESTGIALFDGTMAKRTKSKASDPKWAKLEREAMVEVGKAEADFLDREKDTYVFLQSYWLSTWFFAPLSKTELYVTPVVSENFELRRANLWEINLQMNALWEWKKLGSIYASGWIKYFQNNAANASLMKNVEYEQYLQLPGADTLNFARVGNNKAYIGEYEQFKTTNLNLQVVYMAPFHNKLVKPGLSFRYEKNWGHYAATSLRFGMPFIIQGKDKPINMELQYRLTDVTNYRDKGDHKPGKAVGISLGFPIVLLYK